MTTAQQQLDLFKRRRQQDAIAADLLSGHAVDSVHAAQQHGVWRLSGVIYWLRRQGWQLPMYQGRGELCKSP